MTTYQGVLTASGTYPTEVGCFHICARSPLTVPEGTPWTASMGFSYGPGSIQPFDPLTLSAWMLNPQSYSFSTLGVVTPFTAWNNRLNHLKDTPAGDSFYMHWDETPPQRPYNFFGFDVTINGPPDLWSLTPGTFTFDLASLQAAGAGVQARVFWREPDFFNSFSTVPDTLALTLRVIGDEIPTPFGVPEPATWALILVLLLLLRRRRK